MAFLQKFIFGYFGERHQFAEKEIILVFTGRHNKKDLQSEIFQKFTMPKEIFRLIFALKAE